MTAVQKTFTVLVGQFGSATQLPIEVTEHEPSYLLGRLEICGVDHHVELIEVEIDPDGEQRPKLADAAGNHLDNCNDTRFENLSKFNDNEAFATVEVDGRNFVCVVTPYAR